MTDVDPQTGGAEKYHPQLLLLDEFGGEVKSKQKLHKSLYHVRKESEEWDIDDYTFTHNHFGPTDESLSNNYSAYDSAGLIVIEKEDGAYLYRVTDKGSTVARGLRRGLRKLRGEEANELERSLELVAEFNKDRSGAEIATDWTEQKNEPFGIDQ